MGLDMYLSKRNRQNEKAQEEVGYWRKANHIHKWFVVNVQNGVDDCGSYVVTKEKLEELLKVCHEVMSNPNTASQLLPTQSGFFFGSTDYNSYYFSDVEETIDIITRVLETTDFKEEEIFYYSWW